MQHDRLVLGLAAVFAGMTVLLVVLAAAARSPVPAVVAIAFGLATLLFWIHATGRLEPGIYGRVHWRPGPQRSPESGAGPRDDWEPPGGWERWERGARAGATAGGGRGGRRADRAGSGPTAAEGPSAPEARRILGVEAGADEDALRRAYRERVKEVHPDRGGDEAAFRRVTDAYERLTE